MKKGDLVKAVSTDGTCRKGETYYVSTVQDHMLGVGSLKTHKFIGYMNREHFIKVERKKKMKAESKSRIFRTVKETPELKKGAILYQKSPESGIYSIYSVYSCSKVKNAYYVSDTYYTKNVVEDQPKWFEEVFSVTPRFATAGEIKKLGLKKNG